MDVTTSLKRPLDPKDSEINNEESKRVKVNLDTEAQAAVDYASKDSNLTIAESKQADQSGAGTSTSEVELVRPSYHDEEGPVSRLGMKPELPKLPASLELVRGFKVDLAARKGFVGEEEVGIIGYAGPSDVKGIKGVIKQRFTDFLVNEILPNGEVLHLKDILRPRENVSQQPKGKEKAQDGPKDTEEEQVSNTAMGKEQADEIQDVPEKLKFPPHPRWPSSATTQLRSHLSDDTIVSLHSLLVEGKEPPPKQDAGWGSRQLSASVTEEGAMNEGAVTSSGGPSHQANGHGRGQGRDRGRGKGGRGGGRGGRGGGPWGESRQQDDREVLSQVIVDKDTRTAAHQAIREALGGVFESTTREEPGENGHRLVIKWARGPPRRPRDAERPSRIPTYIHFTLHKSNRETQDALTHLSRLLSVQPKDLSVCGTKDKRAVTVQRVCLKRGGRNLNAVWNMVNGVTQKWRTALEAEAERGDRGVRIGDLSYSDQYLELGMLKGNRFLITLRNVQGQSQEEMERPLASLRDQGFINFFGMQRFGTSTVPTHVTGLYLLRGEWGQAVDSLFVLREGEHPDCVRARLAWLEDKDSSKALALMPRRCVAERCMWEYYSRGNRVEDKLGALTRIPRNLRTMYVHAYQSYIWNLVTSERIKLSPTEPMVGDLVYVDPKAAANAGSKTNGFSGGDRPRKWQSSSDPEVQQLLEADLSKYVITDVVMPIPGWNVDYPGGAIGELYEKIMKADGLDAHKMRRDQREYSLPGGYRSMIIRPEHCSWSHMRYTDPDVALVQSDEDKILGLNPPAEDDPEGKFYAIKLDLQLGASIYATMALREITREETSTWHQIGLTLQSEDQVYKGTAGDDKVEDEGEEAPLMEADE